MTKPAFLAIGLLGFYAVSLIATRQTTQMSPLADVMLEKLDCSHDLLDAMVIEDFNSMENNAGKLVRLSRLSSWNAIRTLEYSQFSSDFQSAGEALVSAAKARNADAATAAYSRLTQACLQCHAHLRRVRKASLIYQQEGDLKRFPRSMTSMQSATSRTPATP